MLRIGFANKFFTLWSVSEPYKCYVDEYSFYWRTDFDYIRNLSIEEKTAQEKARKGGAVNLSVDYSLKGSSSFFRDSEPRVDHEKTPAYIYPIGVHKHGSGDIRDFLSPESPELHEDQIKALWTLYLKKDICFTGENPVRPEWRRPIIYARRKLLEAGILVRYDGRILASSYLDKYKAEQAARGLEDGCFYNDKERIEIELKEVSSRLFEGVGQFGEYSFFIIKYADKKGRAFYYKGSSVPSLSSDDFIQIKGTVKHSLYNGTTQTLLQRISIKK